MTDDQWLDVQTAVAHDPHDERHEGAVTKPIYQNSLFTFRSYDDFLSAMQNETDRSVYSRGTNPTVRELERRLARIERGEEARCFASGMAAISSAILSVVRSGDHIVCVNEAYGPAKEFMGSYLKKYGIDTTFVEGSSLEQIESAIRDNTTLLYLESPTSMLFQVQDLRAAAQLARSKGIATIIDNTWATPCYQNPLEFGFDLVVHSLTKYVSGHSDALGGAVIGSRERMKALVKNEYMLLGGIMTPATASLMMRGLRTLPLRMEKLHGQGLEVARWLEAHALVSRVNHPGLPSHPQHELAMRQMKGCGSLFSFETELPLDVMRRWAEQLKYFRIGVSWGGYESLVTVNPKSSYRPGAQETLVRLYVGLENHGELIADLEQAFDRIAFSS
jgi:cystathionine beta-lyase/cystathionine gamma-synthase